MALSEGVYGFSAINSFGPDNIQQVIIYAEGDDETIGEFSKIIQNEFPPHALVTTVTIEPYEKRVIAVLDYMHLMQVEQLDKGIPAIRSIKSTQEKMLEKQDRTVEETHALRTDLKTEINDRFNKIEIELQMVKDALHRSGIMA
jgi:acylphosphatase